MFVTNMQKLEEKVKMYFCKLPNHDTISFNSWV